VLSWPSGLNAPRFNSASTISKCPPPVANDSADLPDLALTMTSVDGWLKRIWTASRSCVRPLLPESSTHA
jgi:hypothetical protein